MVGKILTKSDLKSISAKIAIADRIIMEREEKPIISEDDILNLKIVLETIKDVNELIEKI